MFFLLVGCKVPSSWQVIAVFEHYHTHLQHIFRTYAQANQRTADARDAADTVDLAELLFMMKVLRRHDLKVLAVHQLRSLSQSCVAGGQEHCYKEFTECILCGP